MPESFHLLLYQRGSLASGSSLTYAEWAPLAPLVESGLIRACAFFLTTETFRLPACDILKQLSHRRQDKVIAAHLLLRLHCRTGTLLLSLVV